MKAPLSYQFVRCTLARMKTLAQVDDKVLATELPKILNVREPKGLIDRLVSYLEGVASHMEEPPAPTCSECGKELDAKWRELAKAAAVSYQTILQDGGIKNARSDRRYCSPKCRQRAYRRRLRIPRATHGAPRKNRNAGGGPSRPPLEAA
jgi:hypothetical protein